MPPQSFLIQSQFDLQTPRQPILWRSFHGQDSFSTRLPLQAAKGVNGFHRPLDSCSKIKPARTHGRLCALPMQSLYQMSTPHCLCRSISRQRCITPTSTPMAQYVWTY